MALATEELLHHFALLFLCFFFVVSRWFLMLFSAPVCVCGSIMGKKGVGCWTVLAPVRFKCWRAKAISQTFTYILSTATANSFIWKWTDRVNVRYWSLRRMVRERSVARIVNSWHWAFLSIPATIPSSSGAGRNFCKALSGCWNSPAKQKWGYVHMWIASWRCCCVVLTGFFGGAITWDLVFFFFFSGWRGGGWFLAMYTTISIFIKSLQSCVDHQLWDNKSNRDDYNKVEWRHNISRLYVLQ